MAIDPTIPLKVQGPRFGEIIGQGILQYRQRQRQEKADERTERALKLKEEAAATKAREAQDKINLKEFATFYQRLDPKGDVIGQVAQERERVVAGSEESEALDEFEESYRRDPIKALKVGEQLVGQARQQKLIPEIKGKRVNAQIPGKEGIIPAIETTEGYLLSTTTGQRMPEAIKAPSRQEAGKAGAFTTRTKGEIEERILTTGEGVARLEDISKTYKPEFQQIGTRLSAAFTAGREKAGLEISKDERSNLKDFSTFKRRAADNLNRTIKDITGAAMSIPEAKRITRSAPNPGTGIFDGDSPTVFKSKLDDTLETLKAANRRMIDLRKKGFTGDISEDIAERFPLSDYKVSTDQNMLDRAQDAINRGADLEAVKSRLRDAGIDPEGLK